MRPAWFRLDLGSAFSRLMAAVIATFLAIGALEAWHAWEARSAAIAADAVETNNLTRSLALHVHDLLQSADVALLGIQERLQADRVSPRSLLRLHDWMAQTVRTIPMIHGIFAYDAAG